MSNDAYMEPSGSIYATHMLPSANDTLTGLSAFASRLSDPQLSAMMTKVRELPCGLHQDRSDSSQVIATLRTSASSIEGRGKWVTAAIDYMRSDNTFAAISVLITMSEG